MCNCRHFFIVITLSRIFISLLQTRDHSSECLGVFCNVLKHRNLYSGEVCVVDVTVDCIHSDSSSGQGRVFPPSQLRGTLNKAWCVCVYTFRHYCFCMAVCRNALFSAVIWLRGKGRGGLYTAVTACISRKQSHAFLPATFLKNCKDIHTEYHLMCPAEVLWTRVWCSFLY